MFYDFITSLSRTLHSAHLVSAVGPTFKKNCHHVVSVFVTNAFYVPVFAFSSGESFVNWLAATNFLAKCLVGFSRRNTCSLLPPPFPPSLTPTVPHAQQTDGHSFSFLDHVPVKERNEREKREREREAKERKEGKSPAVAQGDAAHRICLRA